MSQRSVPPTLSQRSIPLMSQGSIPLTSQKSVPPTLPQSSVPVKSRALSASYIDVTAELEGNVRFINFCKVTM